MKDAEEWEETPLRASNLIHNGQADADAPLGGVARPEATSMFNGTTIGTGPPDGDAERAMRLANRVSTGDSKT